MVTASDPEVKTLAAKCQQTDGRENICPAAAMKRSADVHVKHVIAALCRLLAAAGLDPVPPPDSFRRAKFGDAVQVSQVTSPAALLGTPGQPLVYISI